MSAVQPFALPQDPTRRWECPMQRPYQCLWPPEAHRRLDPPQDDGLVAMVFSSYSPQRIR
jgi:hypothetical protein